MTCTVVVADTVPGGWIAGDRVGGGDAVTVHDPWDGTALATVEQVALGEIVAERDLPTGAFAVLCIDNTSAAALIADPRLPAGWRSGTPSPASTSPWNWAATPWCWGARTGRTRRTSSSPSAGSPCAPITRAGRPAPCAAGPGRPLGPRRVAAAAAPRATALRRGQESGTGREGVRSAMEDFTDVRTLVLPGLS